MTRTHQEAGSAPPRAGRRGACPSLAAPMATGDGLLMRLHVLPSGLTPGALAAVAAAAHRFGNGALEVTRRGSLQARGFTAAGAAAFAEAMEPMAHRLGDGRVLTSPLLGCDPNERPDAPAMFAALQAAVRSVRKPLAPKVTVSLDPGGIVPLDKAADIRLTGTDTGWRIAAGPIHADADATAALALASAILRAIAEAGPDARATSVSSDAFCQVVAAAGGLSGTRWIGENTGVGGARDARTGFSLERAHSRDGVPVTLRGAAAVACASSAGMVGAQLRQGDQRAQAPEARGRARGGDRGRTPRSPQGADVDGRDGAPLGPHGAAFVAAVWLGAIDAGTLAALADALGEAGAEAVTFGHGRRIVARGGEPGRYGAIFARQGLIVAADDPRLAVDACVGRPGCASAHADTRALAAALVGTGATVHVSGCDKRCGAPPDRTAVVAHEDGLTVGGAAAAEVAIRTGAALAAGQGDARTGATPAATEVAAATGTELAVAEVAARPSAATAAPEAATPTGAAPVGAQAAARIDPAPAADQNAAPAGAEAAARIGAAS